MIPLILFVLFPALVFAGGSAETQPTTAPVDDGVPATIRVVEGEHFTHKLKIMPFIRVPNQPQMAVWCETPDGEFVATLFLTERLATQSWRGAPADPTPTDEIRRPESLPLWAHRHGEVYADGLRVPTEENPIADAVTSATPKSSFTVRTQLPAGYEELIVYFEVNHSADFNEVYRADDPEDAATYSGGKWGSGQPALVYRARLNLAGAGLGPTTFELIGHSSPDGSSGGVREDLSPITTAGSIVERVEITVGAKAEADRDDSVARREK
jgi:hypothetical protein